MASRVSTSAQHEVRLRYVNSCDPTLRCYFSVHHKLEKSRGSCAFTLNHSREAMPMIKGLRVLRVVENELIAEQTLNPERVRRKVDVVLKRDRVFARRQRCGSVAEAAVPVNRDQRNNQP